MNGMKKECLAKEDAVRGAKSANSGLMSEEQLKKLNEEFRKIPERINDLWWAAFMACALAAASLGILLWEFVL